MTFRQYLTYTTNFQCILSLEQDMRLDNPDAEHLLTLFLGRVIVDEVLPPAFLTAALPSLENQSLGVNIIQATGILPSTDHFT